MTRLIDADALRKSHCAECYYYNTDHCMGDECDSACVYHIDHAPTVEAVPVVHGHWLVNMFFIECSECGESFTLEPQNYCPHCGAKMDEVTNGQKDT